MYFPNGMVFGEASEDRQYFQSNFTGEKTCFYLFVLVVACLAAAVTSCAPTSYYEKVPAPPIVLVSFEEFPTDSTPIFKMLETGIRTRFPGHIIRWAFTNDLVLRKIEKEDPEFFMKRAGGRKPEDVIRQLSREGHKIIIVQPLHMMPMEEEGRLTSIIFRNAQIVRGGTIIDSAIHFDSVTDALEPQIREKVPTIIAAPGDTFYETLLVQFANTIENQYPNVFVFSTEGLPGKRSLGKLQVQAQNFGSIRIIPFVFLPRENDVLEQILEENETGDLLEKFQIKYSKPLSEIEEIRQILYERIDEAVYKANGVR